MFLQIDGLTLVGMFFVQLATIFGILAMCGRKSKKNKLKPPNTYVHPKRHNSTLPRLGVAPPPLNDPSQRSIRPAQPFTRPAQPFQQANSYTRPSSAEVTAKEMSQRAVVPKSRPSFEDTQKSIKTQKVAAQRQQQVPQPKPLKMEPPVLRWKPDGGIQTVSIRNQSNERHAVKVKCSDNQLYRVNPVYSFVDPGQVLNVDVLRQSGPAKVDKMIFVTAKANSNDYAPSAVFDKNNQNAAMVLPLIAQNA